MGWLLFLLDVRGCREWHTLRMGVLKRWLLRREPKGRGSRLRGQDAVADVRGVPAVLGAVGGVDPVVDAVVGVGDRHVFADAAGLDVSLVTDLASRRRGRRPRSCGRVRDRRSC
jgi:hypothetical protein